MARDETTLTVDDDVLGAVKEIASREQKTMGEVISELVRRAMRPAESFVRTRNGIPLLPIRPDAWPVTLEMVNNLQDELP